MYLTRGITNRDGTQEFGIVARAGDNVGPLSPPIRAHGALRKSERRADFSTDAKIKNKKKRKKAKA